MMKGLGNSNANTLLHSICENVFQIKCLVRTKKKPA